MKLRNFFGRKILRNQTLPQSQRNRKTRLELESLEDRTLMTGNATGVITGTAFIDFNNNAAFDSTEGTLPGVNVNLTGTTNQALPVNVNATTNASGKYTFDNVLPGTYQISSGPAQNVVGGGSNVFSGLVITENNTVTQDLPYSGLAPSGISMRQFLTSTTSSSFQFGTPGSGTGLGNFRPNNRPIVETPLPNVNVAQNAANTVVDLAAFFDDQDVTNSQVRLETSAGAVNIELFDKQAPQTVANYFNYITSDRYDHSIFHRRANNQDGTTFVLQGGGFRFNENPSNVVAITADPGVKNEFSQSNTKGTVAMAKLPGNPDSATDEFFINMGNNGGTSPNGLDFQNGGFTVFGKLVGAADQAIADALAAIPIQNKSAFNSAFDTLPLQNYTGNNFPTDSVAANYALLNNVSVTRHDEFLSYAVIGNTNPSLVTATLNNNRLTLQYAAGQSGNATITLRAFDRFGATVDTSFLVTVT